MESKINSYEFAKLLQTALIRGQNENQMTVNKLLDEIACQLEILMEK